MTAVTAVVDCYFSAVAYLELLQVRPDPRRTVCVISSWMPDLLANKLSEKVKTFTTHWQRLPQAGCGGRGA